jgi:hypothetical protein
MSGYVSSLAGFARYRIAKLKFYGEELRDAKILVNIDMTPIFKLTFDDFSARVGDGDVGILGEILLDRINLALSVTNVDIIDVKQVSSHIPFLGGVGEVIGHILGVPENPYFSGSVELGRVYLEVAGKKFVLGKFSGDLDINKDVIQIGGEFTLGDGSIAPFVANIPLDGSGKLEASLSGKYAELRVEEDTKMNKTEIGGYFNLKSFSEAVGANLLGDVDFVGYVGERTYLKIDVFSFGFSSEFLDAEKLSVSATFTDDVVKIERISGYINGGAISGSGEFSFASDTAGMMFDFRSLSIRVGESSHMLADGNLSIHGKFKKPVISGDVYLDNIFIDIEDVSGSEFGFDFKEPEFSPVFDINLHIRDRAYMSSAFFEAIFTGKLLLSGSVPDILINGELTADGGTIKFAEREFIITSGRVHFIHDKAFIDLTSRSTISMEDETLDVIVDIKGPASKPSIFLSSIPRRPESEIICALVSGTTCSSLGGDAGKIVERGGDIIIKQAVRSKLKPIEERVGVKLEPGLGNFSLIKRINPFSIIMSWDMISGNRRAEVNYTLTKDFGIKASLDSENIGGTVTGLGLDLGNLGLDFTFRKKF